MSAEPLINIQYIGVSDIEMVWDDVAPFLNMALEHCGGTHNIDHIKQAILDKKHHLLIITVDNALVGSAVTMTIKYPLKTYLRIAWLGGYEMDNWITPLYDHLIEGAERLQIDGIELQGRRGWLRHFKEQSDTEFVTMRHNLEHNTGTNND